MFSEDNAENPDGWRLGNGRSTHRFTRGLSAARDQIKAQLGDGHGLFQSVR